MNLRTPNLLKAGDTVALVGPASPMKTDADVDGCIRLLETMGFQVRPFASARAREDYLAGNDAVRAGDLDRAFRDPEIKGIFCIRGGYGSSRLLPRLDWRSLAATGKLFSGFSDLTSVMNGLLQEGGLITIHAPTIGFLDREEKATVVSREALLQFVTKGFAGVSYRNLCGEWFTPQTVVPGRATGTLVGGNLSLFAGLTGTPWMPTIKGCILFVEEIHEKPYKLDRYLTQLINAGYFRNVAGIAIGGLDDCDPVPPDYDDATTVMIKCLKPLGIPVLAGLPIGHGRPSFPLPLGATVELDATEGDLKVMVG